MTPTSSNAAGAGSAAAIPAAAAWLGGLGLLPFAAPVAVLWLGPADWEGEAWRVLRAYAAVILSFVGAIHWGAALRENEAGRLWRAMGWSVVPALVAWVALLLAPPSGVALLLLGFGAQYWMDRWAVAAGWLPGWYGRLRRILTSGVVACLALALVWAA
ncbi:MAG: DUF3429 domain-containing protein [Candidatus Competibacteraceae bacterium]|jgi:hypothetical protein|nr:MAG: DUF3429 domain-containing protein [Candidatus Competibacteraceae bacterium]